jgi:hypothetical protein
VRYHGTLAPNARLRASIVQAVAEQRGGRSRANRCSGVGETVPLERSRKACTWVELMSRVLEQDVQECVRCRGRLALIATITQPSVIRAMPACIGLPARPPPLAPARGAWQEELTFEDA